ncbi:MAG: penicillin acylase family protein [Candidatus Hodarchaeales archaeon]
MKSQTVTIIKMIIAGFFSVIMLIALSTPLGIIPPLGSFLLPGNGIWDVPQEVSSREVLTSSSLTDEVKVYRDEWGIPHIYGNSEADLMFALGYCHAQDRWFQMDIFRRMASGRLSEIMGPASLETDKFNKMKLQEYWANETVKYLETNKDNDPEIKDIYDSLITYVAGINTYITTHTEKPFEYQLLDIEIMPWSVVDVMVLVKFLSEYFTWGYTDMQRFQAVDGLGMADYTELFGFPLPYQLPVVPGYGEYDDISLPSSVKNPVSKTASGKESTATSSSDPSVSGIINPFMDWIESMPLEKERIERQNSQTVGSNNWAVSGNKTATGMPMVGTDMHLGWTLPGMWYEAHLVDMSSDLNVYGLFLPGTPLPAGGHTAYVGWGNTIAAFDLLDWYYYNGINDTHYLYNGEATAYETMDVSIPVKGQDPEEFTIKSTVHGPVFTGLVPMPDNFTDYVVACKWVSQNVTMDFRAVYGYMHAKDIYEFHDSTEYFEMLPLNIAAADIEGNIGIWANAKLPIRNDTNLPSWHTGGGSMPYNGSAGEGEWLGYLPFENRTYAINPEQGYVCSANQVVAGPDYPNVDIVNQGGAMGYRARRINDVLASNNEITIDDLVNLHLDVYSVRAGNFTPYLLDAMDTISTKTDLQTAVYNELDNWDFFMDKDEEAPTIFNIWLDIYHYLTFNDEMEGYDVPRTPSWAVLEKLTREKQDSKWFNNITTDEAETMDDIILSALDFTLVGLVEYFGTEDISQWTWGSIHQLKFSHLFELFSGITALSAGPFPGNGTGVTVNPSGTGNFNFNTWKVKAGSAGGGASERILVDFSEGMNNSISVIPSGERGFSSSKHYTDQLEELFLKGEYHVQYFLAKTPEDIQAQAVRIESVIIFKAGE